MTIPGATQATYVLAATTPADDGAQFDVVVCQGAHCVTSPSATLTVLRPVVDNVPPVIMLLETAQVSVEVNTAYLDAGATATDNLDVDLTGNIVTSGLPIDTSVLGSTQVSYDVSDASGNAAVQVTRTVTVVDTTLPTITLLGSNLQVLQVGTAYTELGATATDNGDGNLTANIVINATAVNTSVVGNYPVTYNVTDSSGNAAAQVTRTVTVVGDTPPTAPTNLRGAQIGTAELRLTWDPSSDDNGVVEYRIESCHGSTCTNFRELGTSITTSFDTFWCFGCLVWNPRYRVRAVDTKRNFSAYSNID